MAKDALQIIGLIVGLFLVWLLIGNTQSSIFDRDSSSDSSNTASFSRQSRPSRSQREVDPIRTSQYTGMIELSRGDATEESAKEEYVEIEADSRNENNISITGWKLVGTTGSVVTIKRAALLPDYHNTSIQTPVILAPGDTVYVVSGTSPVGTSFRTSKCTGYFTENKTFYPRLRKQCPRVHEEDIDSYGIDSDPREDSNDERCIRYLRRIPQCTDPDRPDEELNLSRDCEKYVNQIDYDMCVDLHKDDSDFARGTWYVYVGNVFNDLWDDDSDTITLFDSSGEVVDLISY